MNKPDRIALRRGTRIVADTVLGYVILAAGIVLLVTPGPGILVVIAGLALLARHYRFADRLRRAAMRRISDAGMQLRARRSAGQSRWPRRRASPGEQLRNERSDGEDVEAA